MTRYAPRMASRKPKRPTSRRASTPQPDSTLARLFDAVYARPDDDAPRFVLGDALLERGDPRGELIAEQRRRYERSIARPTTRERALVKAHGEAWLAPLSGVLRQPAYRLGFLSSAALKGGVHDFAAFETLREWRTIERLQIGATSEDMAAALLAMPELVSLREVSAVSVPVIETVFQRRGPLPWTTLTSVPIYGRASPFDGFELLAGLGGALPALTHLGLAGSSMMAFELDAFEALLDSDVVTRLEHLELHCDETAVEPVLERAVRRGLRRVVVHAGGDSLTWDGAVKTLTVPEGADVAIPGVTIAVA